MQDPRDDFSTVCDTRQEFQQPPARSGLARSAVVLSASSLTHCKPNSHCWLTGSKFSANEEEPPRSRATMSLALLLAALLAALQAQRAEAKLGEGAGAIRQREGEGRQTQRQQQSARRGAAYCQVQLPGCLRPRPPIALCSPLPVVQPATATNGARAAGELQHSQAEHCSPAQWCLGRFCLCCPAALLAAGLFCIWISMWCPPTLSHHVHDRGAGPCKENSSAPCLPLHSPAAAAHARCRPPALLLAPALGPCCQSSQHAVRPRPMPVPRRDLIWWGDPHVRLPSGGVIPVCGTGSGLVIFRWKDPQGVFQIPSGRCPSERCCRALGCRRQAAARAPADARLRPGMLHSPQGCCGVPGRACRRCLAPTPAPLVVTCRPCRLL